MEIQTEQIIAGRYEVVKSISGGMGVVYLCKDKANNDLPIALKTFQAKFLPDLDSREKFLHEAKLWVDLGWHPNIVQAFGAEYVTETHEIYLALELIPTPPGKKDPSLRSWIIPNSPLSQQKAFMICIDIARGMKFATKKMPGLIHRDLKPENILLGLDGVARITDFGLAKTAIEKAMVEKELQSETNEGVGTPLYMSPEQWLEQKTRNCSDIYSFGCIVYELITGDLAVDGNSLEELALNHIRGMAFEKASDLNIPEIARNFILKCVCPEPDQRFQAWDDVEDGLIVIIDNLFNLKVETETVAVDVSRFGQIQKGGSLLALGNSYLDLGKPTIAIKYYEEAIIIGEKQQYPRLVAACKANIGISKFNLGKYQDAISYYHQAIEIDVKHSFIDEAVLNYGNVGNAYFQIGDFEKARQHIEKAIRFAQEIQNSHLEFFWVQNLANVFSVTGANEQALELYQRIYDFSQSQKDPYGISGALTGIGIASERLGKLSEAITAFEKALAIAQQLGDQKAILISLRGISHIFARQNKIVEALKFVEMELSIAENINDQNAIADALCDIGKYHFLKGDFEKATEKLSRALILSKGGNNKRTQASILWSIGLLNELKGEFPDAIRNLGEAVRLFKELGIPEYNDASKHLLELRRHFGLL